MACFGLDDVGRQFEHVLGDFLVRDVVEVVVFFAYLIGIPERHAKQTFAARF